MRKNTFSILAIVMLAVMACQPEDSASGIETPGTQSIPSTAPSVTESAVPASRDFSRLSYTVAFDKLFETVRREYAFNGVTGKQPDWDAVYAELQPRILQAETARDAQAYFLALRDFTLAFKDGHVNLGGGEIQVALFRSATEGGYGFAMRELDDGRVLVTYVKEGGPAAGAGMQVGAEVTMFNGEQISAAIDAVKLWGAPPSLESSRRYQQSRYLTRSAVGTDAVVAFVNPGGQPQTVTLMSVAEHDSFAASSIFLSYSAEAQPVEYGLLPSGVGHIRVISTADNRELITSLFENALRDFTALNVPGVIIDLRMVVNVNPDTSLPPLGLAGYFSSEAITLGRLQYFSTATGGFEDEGLPGKILPNEKQYHFEKIVLLVGPACSDACEVEAYALSQIPGVIVVGQYPSAGVVSDVARGQFLLPEGFSFQVPTGRFVLPDGEILLEGQGVPLTVRVPVDEATVLSGEDVVLNAAEAIVR